jgi:hypothetical protein
MVRGLEVVRVEKVAESRDGRVWPLQSACFWKMSKPTGRASRCQFTPRKPTLVMRTYEVRLCVTVIDEKPSYVQELILRIHFLKGTNVLIKLFLETLLGILGAAD